MAKKNRFIVILTSKNDETGFSEEILGNLFANSKNTKIIFSRRDHLYMARRGFSAAISGEFGFDSNFLPKHTQSNGASSVTLLPLKEVEPLPDDAFTADVWPMSAHPAGWAVPAGATATHKETGKAFTAYDDRSTRAAFKSAILVLSAIVADGRGFDDGDIDG